MTIHFALNEDQRDCLQEVINVAIGSAGDVLARFLGVFVRLSVPHIQLLDARDLPALIENSKHALQKISAVRQGFNSVLWLGIRGEAVVAFGDASFHEMAKLLGHENSEEAIDEAELLLDVGNIVAGNCLSHVARQLDGEMVFSAPSLLLLQRPLAELPNQLAIEWETVLLIEIHYTLESGDFSCTLMLLMPNEVLMKLGAMLDQILESL